MYYDRREVKLAAKSIIRETRPKPTWITFAYLMMVSLISCIVAALFMVPYISFLGRYISGGMDPNYVLAFMGGMPMLLFFAVILLALYSMVMQYGYCRYVINVKRQLPSGFRDLFSGFSRVGRILMLNLLISVFTFLWSMLGWVVMVIVIFISALIGAPFLTIILMIAAYIGFFIFLMNRTLRYAPALLIMVDHPELTAREALNESKAIMGGNVWNLFVFEISFIGWNLLVFAIDYAIILFGMFLAGSFSGSYANPEAVTVPLLVSCVVAFIATAFLSMWITAYQSVAFVGFYDAINGFDRADPQPLNDVPSYPPPIIPPQVESPAPVSEPAEAPIVPDETPDPDQAAAPEVSADPGEPPEPDAPADPEL